MPPLREFQSVVRVAGPILAVSGIDDAGYNEVVTVLLPDGTVRTGQVLESRKGMAIVMVFGGTRDLDCDITAVRFTGRPMTMPVSKEMLGRIFSGSAEPIDGGGAVVPEKEMEISGYAINPTKREFPQDSIETGISAIDGMNTLVRGQKLPVFSGSGLPHSLLAAQITRQARVRGSDESFAVVFAAMGITHEEARFFIDDFSETGAQAHAVIFLNRADDPAIERIVTPRLALTAAEYLAFDLGMHVLVVMQDITAYCEALREVSAAREEIPARRGYPGYMYTDLASLYERAGRVKGRPGSITQLPILSMPDDDITHPVPDLTGYITEGQIVLSRELHRKGIYPPIDLLPCLSRLMQGGIGEGRTRADHANVSSQLYAAYARGRRLAGLVAVIGDEGLTDVDRLYLTFLDRFEHEFVGQKRDEGRSFDETLDRAWELLSIFPKDELNRIDPKYIEEYYRGGTG
ncbi:MAG: V-type ATP synthase beta chain [Methanomicrobiales archaeon 53_19]|uniref:V-type ATP synthase subunit B n=1 Tax=Methanocalculus sp. TaxID=2004547 RepID=UPI0007482203|nr:V-type ATP synthase subunit B [Methanocalculus sp.]KUK68429.1 MAG: V-type ATP synthase beta chain [Methanocalculus sp. 52_23]KUL02548.1 MAG: V-type ATP synthase beta chain [Methanomicrobiales archaeon 53_19]HIJ06368.1 V-type ATP synthase subunit B [Methanocalculus sp.]